MRIAALGDLAGEMWDQGVRCQVFEHQHGRGAFDIMLFVGERSSELLIGARGARPPLAICVEVDQRGEFTAYLNEDDYKSLCAFLQLEYDPDNRFSTRGFFAELARSVPAHVDPGRTPTPRQVAQYRRVEEDGDKLDFVCWTYHTVRHASEENLAKTRALLGLAAYDLCLRANASSCWTNDPTLAVAIDLQELQGRARRRQVMHR